MYSLTQDKKKIPGKNFANESSWWNWWKISPSDNFQLYSSCQFELLKSGLGYSFVMSQFCIKIYVAEFSQHNNIPKACLLAVMPSLQTIREYMYIVTSFDVATDPAQTTPSN